MIPSRLFVDSSALIALALTNDQYHPHARAFVEEVGIQGRYITTDFVLDEVVTLISRAIGHAKGVEFAEGVIQSHLYSIRYVDETLFRAGLKTLQKFADQGLSCTDAVSFACMRALGIHEAFSFDTDFRKAGFVMHPAPHP